MDKENFQIHGGSFLLSSNPRPGSSFNGKFEAVSSSSSSMPFPPIMASNANNSDRFSHDINRMPETPPRNLGHRRAHSEILTLPDDICFDSELGFIGGDNGPSLSDDTEEDLLSIYLDMDKFNSSESVKPDSAFSRDDVSVGLNERPRVRHQHSQSMDGFTNIKPEMLVSVSEEVSIANSKKALSAANLAELALVDPKRAKRIWANRQSAARSKERKMRYIGELERKVQTLQTDATSLSAQMTLLQRDSNGLTAENGELKLRLQTMEQQVHLQDALNEALKEEIQHMKILTGQAMSNDGSVTKFASFGSGQQFYPNNQELHTLLSAQQLQQLHIQSQKQKQHFQYHHQLQQQQQTGDMKMKGSIPSPNQNDNLSDSSSSAAC